MERQKSVEIFYQTPEYIHYVIILTLQNNQALHFSIFSFYDEILLLLLLFLSEDF